MAHTRLNKKEIKKILIVNRSEVALRIQKSCHALGIKSVALYTQEDKNLSYVYNSHEAYALSGSGLSAYTTQDEILSIAQQTQVDAIHPGYGFLSENGYFAQKVINSGYIWVGPNPNCMLLMSNKHKAKECAQENNIPTVPWSILPIHTPIQEAQVIATQMGYPVIIKDPLSGGGKATRIVLSAQDFNNAWERVISESQKLTQSSTIIIEKYIQNPRHIEIQVAGDGTNAIHLFERECSIQRRHQKIIEETPCRFVSPDILKKLYHAACTITQATGYNNIGTVEFIVTPDNTFYFLEMNTRLQVEHSVTELTTGIDLVALQIILAQTGKLTYTQEQITRHGHAIECRIYAEDPFNNFIPSSGHITNLVIPDGPFMRIDHDLHNEYHVSPFFDPMIAKVTVSGHSRDQVIKHLQRVLSEFFITGVTTNIFFLKKLLATREFLQGDMHTQLLTPEFIKNLNKTQHESPSEQITPDVGAALYLLAQQLIKQTHSQEGLNSQAQRTQTHYYWKNKTWRP